MLGSETPAHSGTPLSTIIQASAGTNLVVVRAEAHSHLDGLARGVCAALRVGGLLIPDGQRGRAHERAVLLGRVLRVLQRALGCRSHAGRHVGGARLGVGARGRAEVAANTRDGDLELVRRAARLGVAVVRATRGRRRRRRRAHVSGTGRIRGLRGDAAHVLALDHADVARLAPGRTPRVLHLVVVLARVRAEADRKHTVVEVGAARDVVEDARLVELEGGLVGLDGDGNGLLRDGVLERRLVARWHVLEARDRHLWLQLRRVARTGDTAARRVRVVLLRGDAVLLNVLEGIVHEATVAAHVAIVVT
mmetsp:Transcript_9889/g.25494  ORF Transcript_9889/g.25494 Transcript_9889/m.25494 type:complete len:307 (+) Transcript_9889:377-1297(+)